MPAVVRALMLERWLLYVLRAGPNPFSKRRRVEPFAFRLSAFKVFGGGIVGRVRGFDGDGFDLFGGAFGLQRRGFGIFGNVGSQNVRPFIGRALFNGGGIVGFDCGKRFRWSFCLRARVMLGGTE